MRLLKRFFARPMNGVVAALAVLGATGTGVMLNAAPAFALTPSCTFSPTSAADGTSVSNAAGQVIKGVNAGSSITLSCTGFSSLDTLFIVEASPLAGIVQPLSLTNQSAEGQLTAVGADASGHFSGTFIVKKTGDATNPFTAVDPAAACPPTAAQINAGLTNCVITVADIAGNRPPGQPFLSFAGQASSGNPTLTVNTPAITVNDTVTVGESGGHSTFWWSGAFIGGAPSTGSTVYTGANTTAGAIATATTISVASTATFASSGTIDVTNAAAGTDTYTYTGTTATRVSGLTPLIPVQPSRAPGRCRPRPCSLAGSRPPSRP